MARARNIKPAFFKNELLCDIKPLGRLLFIGLWGLADREGKLEDRPKRIKMDILPCDECNIDDLLWSLHEANLIFRYEVGGGAYISIPKFLIHQRPHCKENPSKIPDCGLSGKEKTRTSTYPGRCLHALNPSSLNPSSLNPESLSLEAASPFSSRLLASPSNKVLGLKDFDFDVSVNGAE